MDRIFPLKFTNQRKPLTQEFQTLLTSFFLMFFASIGLANPFDRFTPESRELKIGENRQLSITLSLPDSNKKPYPLALFLQGSGCAHSDTVHITAHRLFEKYQVGILSIEKFGIRKGILSIFNIFHCPQQYWENNIPSVRSKDILSTLYALKSELPNWNGDLLVIGGQTAGAEALLVAKNYRQTTAMILTNYGAGIKYSKPYTKLSDCYQNKTKCEKIEDENQKIIAQLKTGPITNQRIQWGLMKESMRWWKEAFEFDDSILQIDVPTLVLHGGINQFIGSESSDQLFKLNADHRKLLTYKKFEDLDHSWRQINGKSKLAEVWEHVSEYLATFLKEKTES